MFNTSHVKKVVAVPDLLVESGRVRLVAVDHSHTYKKGWDYIMLPLSEDDEPVGDAFKITQKELEKLWKQKSQQNSSKREAVSETQK